MCFEVRAYIETWFDMSFGKREGEGSLYKTHSAGIKLDGSGFVSLYLLYHAVRGAGGTRALTFIQNKQVCAGTTSFSGLPTI